MSEKVCLSKFIAISGIMSRRAAEKAVRSGTVTVNGQTVKSPEFRVGDSDQVKVDGKLATSKSDKVCVVLNKPEGFITSTSDTKDRPTVIDLLPKRLKDQVYPVGRLDFMTKGILLLTNDGELSYKLAHPKFGVQKTYLVTLDKAVKQEDLAKICEGFYLNDGFIKADSAHFAASGGKRKVVVRLHSGRNRIVRRIFRYLFYNVVTLERVGFAGLSLKDLAPGQTRLLSAKEIEKLSKKKVSGQA